MNYDYVTYNGETKYGFIETNGFVVVYVNDKKWGTPQGNRFLKALLKDIKELKRSNNIIKSEVK